MPCWDHKKADAEAPVFLRSPLSEPPAPPVRGIVSAFGRAAEAALSLRSEVVPAGGGDVPPGGLFCVVSRQAMIMASFD